MSSNGPGQYRKGFFEEKIVGDLSINPVLDGSLGLRKYFLSRSGISYADCGHDWEDGCWQYRKNQGS